MSVPTNNGDAVSNLIKKMVDQEFTRISTSEIWEVLDKAKDDENFNEVYQIVNGAVQDRVSYIEDIGSKMGELLKLEKIEREALYRGLNENGMGGDNVFEAVKNMPLHHLGRLLWTTSELNGSGIYSKEAYKVVLDAIDKGYDAHRLCR